MGYYIFFSIVIGSIFILFSLLIVILKHDLSPQGFWIIRVLVALGAGFVAAGILGNLEITGPIANLTIKAGGPIALTVIIYLLNPPKIVIDIRKKSLP